VARPGRGEGRHLWAGIVAGAGLRGQRAVIRGDWERQGGCPVRAGVVVKQADALAGAGDGLWDLLQVSEAGGLAWLRVAEATSA
jgi:hypothetical protein